MQYVDKRRVKQALRDEAKATEHRVIDGVTVGVPKGASDENLAAITNEVRAIMADPNSQFNIDQRKRKTARSDFDKRRVVVAEKARIDAEKRRNKENAKLASDGFTGQ